MQTLTIDVTNKNYIKNSCIRETLNVLILSQRVKKFDPTEKSELGINYSGISESCLFKKHLFIELSKYKTMHKGDKESLDRCG